MLNKQSFYKKLTFNVFGFLFMSISLGYGQTLISETLRTGSLPVGWNQSDISFETAAGGYARFDQTTSVLTTPTFNASANASIDIEFDVAKWGSGGDGPVTVEYSLDGGATWTIEGNSTTPTNSTYQNNTISINTTSATMQVRFIRASSPSRKRLRDVIIVGVGSCSITDISITNSGTCNDNGTPADSNDDYYLADVEVTYSNPPASGSLNLTGSGVVGGNVSDIVGSSVQTISGVQLKADGNDVEITATFSADPSCNYTEIITGSGVAACSSGGGSSCVNESFDNMGPYGGYQIETWTGDDGFTWTATDARTDRSINGPGIMVRNGSLSANNITGGISSLTLTTQRQFSGGSGNLTVYVNGTSVGTIPYSGSVQTNTISNINVPGTYDLEIETTNSDRIVMDDLEIICFTSSSPVVGFDSASSTENETNSTFAVNIPVTLSNFSTNVDLSVSVDGSSTAEASDYTLNTTSLSFTGNGTQNISLDINPDAGYDDETIILEIAETTSTGLTINTSQHTVTILDDETAPLGWQITVEDTYFVIDFDNVAGNNNSSFDGSGFSPSPITGQLNSQAWKSTGMSDGNSNFGDTKTSNDFARGSSTGGETIGGFYAFETSSNDFSLGFQGTDSDFTPGTITLRAQNQTGDTIYNANLSYILYVLNDQGRANSLNFSYSTDGINYTTIPSLDFTSAEVADGSPVWVSNAKAAFISGLSIADGEHLYLRWESDDVSGNGSRDEFAIDDITFNFNPSSPLPVELISFDATVVDRQKSVLLEWETASENNNDYFSIERSADGYNWESITSVNGMGNSSTTTSYDYKDRQPMKGVSYYRLKQNDFNGDSEYFDIRSVMINADDKALLYRVNMLGQKVNTSYKGLVFLVFSDGSKVQILQNN